MIKLIVIIPIQAPASFEVLESLIQKTYDQGGVLHFWFWGDESRKQTPIKWGKEKEVDQRLQRYIATRLGRYSWMERELWL